MRVAVLAHSFPRFAGDTHGPFVKRLSESLAARGHRVTALIPFDPRITEDKATPLAIETFRYVWPDRWHLLGYSRTLKRDVGLRLWAYLQSPLYFLAAERALSRLVVRRQIELIHAHWILPNGYVAARVARRFGLPLAITLHGSDVFMAERNPLFRRMAATALAQAAHVTSCSPELKDRLVALGGREHEAKVVLLANGTDLTAPAAAEDAAAVRARWNLPAGGPLLVAVGRLVDKKGFDVLLAALPAILAAHPTAHLALGGGGDLEPALRALAARSGVADRVTFTGLLAHPEVLALIAAGDVFLMPSIRDPRGNVDGLPIVVLEAMAAGKPVVGTAVSGLPLAILPGETGLLVPEKDPRALAAAVSELLAQPQRARELGLRGRRRVIEELNWSTIAAEHDRLYRRAAGEGAAA